MIRLYSFLCSPNPLKVRLALYELKVPFETVEVNLLEGEQRSEEFRGVNPAAQVPALVDGALTLRESNAILAYLGREYGGKGRNLWSTDPRRESEALQWLFFEAAQLSLRCGLLWFNETLARIGREPAHPEVLQAAAEGLERPLDVLDAHLERHLYMLGQDFSLVDCSLGVTLTMLKGTSIDDRERWPNVASYREKIWKRQSWKEADGEAILRF